MTDTDYLAKAREMMEPRRPDPVQIIAGLLAAIDITKVERDSWALEARRRREHLRAAEDVNAMQAQTIEDVQARKHALIVAKRTHEEETRNMMADRDALLEIGRIVGASDSGCGGQTIEAGEARYRASVVDKVRELTAAQAATP